MCIRDRRSTSNPEHYHAYHCRLSAGFFHRVSENERDEQNERNQESGKDDCRSSARRAEDAGK